MLKLAAYVQTFLGRFDRDEEGQTMAEYGVVLALITLAVIGVFTTLGTQIGAKITGVTKALGG